MRGRMLVALAGERAAARGMACVLLVVRHVRSFFSSVFPFVHPPCLPACPAPAPVDPAPAALPPAPWMWRQHWVRAAWRSSTHPVGVAVAVEEGGVAELVGGVLALHLLKQPTGAGQLACLCSHRRVQQEQGSNEREQGSNGRAMRGLLSAGGHPVICCRAQGALGSWPGHPCSSS